MSKLLSAIRASLLIKVRLQFSGSGMNKMTDHGSYFEWFNTKTKLNREAPRINIPCGKSDNTGEL
jgi:hypothetical protein